MKALLELERSFPLTVMSRVGPRPSSRHYSLELEQEAQRWIEEVTEEPFEGPFMEELQDGRRLCLLMNKIKPGAVRRVNTSKMPFKQMENVSNFIKAVRETGVKEYSLFETVDLFELKDVGLVVKCLVSSPSPVSSVRTKLIL